MATTAPLDTVESALYLARERLNDMIQSVNGNILTDLAPFTPSALNGALRRLQEVLSNFGFSDFDLNTELLTVPVAGTADPGVFCSISWANFFDGNAAQPSPVLPQNMVAPLELYSRISGYGGTFRKMTQAFNGLPAISKEVLLRNWEWKGQTINVCGSTVQNDIRLRYAQFFPDFLLPAAEAYSLQFIPIVRALNPFTDFLCLEVSMGRNDLDSATFEKRAMDGCAQMFNRDPQQRKSIYKGAEYGKMVDQYSRTEGPAEPREKAAQ